MSRSLPAQFSTQPTLVSALCPKAGCWKGTGFEDARSPLLPPGLFHQILLPATLPASRAPPRGSSHQGFASRVLSTRTSRFKGSSPRFLAPGLSASGALPTKVPRIRALPIRDLNLSDVDSSRITASISEARSSQPLGYGRGEVDAAVSELPEISGARIWEGIVV